MVNKIHKTKTEGRLGNHQAIRKVTGVTTPWTTECLECLFLQPNSRIQHARPKWRGWSRCSRTHQHEESFLQDLSQTQKINKFSKESQDLIADLNNTEIFEFFQTTMSWLQICCNCGRNMQSTRNPTETDHRDATSIPGHVIRPQQPWRHLKKNRSHGAKHGASERQKVYCRAKQILRRPSNEAIHDGTCANILGRRERCIFDLLAVEIGANEMGKLVFTSGIHRVLRSTPMGDPFVVPGSPTSSSTSPTPASSSSSQDSVFDVNRYTQNPAPERSGSTSEELRGNPLHEPTETENQNKTEEAKKYKANLSHDLLEWLQDLRENLVDERSEPRGNPAPEDQDILLMNYQWSREQKWNRVRRTQIAKSAWRQK